MCRSLFWTYPYGLCPTRECVCIPFCLFWTKQLNRPPSGNRSLKKLAWRKSRPKPLTLSRHADAARDFLAWFSALFSRSLLPKSFSFKSCSLSRKPSFVNFLDMVAPESLPPFENAPPRSFGVMRFQNSFAFGERARTDGFVRRSKKAPLYAGLLFFLIAISVS